MKRYGVEVTRDGKWWMVSIPEIDGLTQARRVSEVERTAREYIALTTDSPLSQVEVDITLNVGDLKSVNVRAARIREERERAAQLEAHVLAESRALAHDLAAHAVPVRDIGILLGVAFQRASQLINS